MMKIRIACLAGAAASISLLHAQAANAATETVLYSFCSQNDCADGGEPTAPLTIAGDTLYGTASDIDSPGAGTIYALDPRSGAEKTVFAFSSENIEGALPNGGILNVNNTLYGLTELGGTYVSGALFSLDRKTGAETVVHSFGDPGDGDSPYWNNSLILVKGKLYGTTYSGGAYNNGVVFSVDPRSGTETILHSFQNADGANPTSGLIEIDGMLYGTTASGGPSYQGTVFSISPETGAEAVLYSFKGGSDGGLPAGGLLAYKGILYGTTSITAFSLDPRKDVETVLHTFRGGADGSGPVGSLIDVHGTLYGATRSGGTGCRGGGCGTVFSMNPRSGAENVVYAFQDNGGSDGNEPYAGLVEFKGALYGTTVFGGANNSGTIYKVTP